MSADEIGGQIGQMGQKSMQFLSESFANLQTGVKVSVCDKHAQDTLEYKEALTGKWEQMEGREESERGGSGERARTE